MKRIVILVVLVVGALAAASVASAGEPLDRPVKAFSARDRADALALMRSVSTTSDPKAYVRCGIRRRVAPRATVELLECVRYDKPALTTRYHRDVFDWQRYEGGLILAMKRDGKKTVLVAQVKKISRTSFWIVQVICGEGARACA